MSLTNYLGTPVTWIGIVSGANLCLMLWTAFLCQRVSGASDGVTKRVKFGHVAVSFGLCSQALYCVMMVAWISGWAPLSEGISVDQFQTRLCNFGIALSFGTFVTALFGRGLRRIAGLWVAVTTGFLWGLAGLGASIRSIRL